MTSTQSSWLLALFLRLTIPKPKETPSEWVSHNVQFSEPGCTGPFVFDGREYLRDPIDDWGLDEVSDQTIVFATRMGKTRSIYAGLAYRVAQRPTRALYVKPKAKGVAGAEDDTRNRFIPMLRASPPLAALIPGGRDRHQFKTLSQRLGGSLIDWTGSNSVAALASNPCDVVVQDETDKFGVTRKRDEDGNTVEADPSSLADERTNECPTPKRVKSSTPTLAGGTIWSKLLKSDLRRYHVPCPHCDKPVVFAWNRDFTILPKTGREAYVKFDGKRADGSRDEEAVKLTAHAECPHCQGKITDSHKGWMLREAWLRSQAGNREYGWVPTQTGTPGHRGYHLPAMYGMHKASNFGEMAVRFLAEVHSLRGAQGFINSMLAEPYEAQASIGKRTELIKSRIVEVNSWSKIQYIDCQAVAPYFWFVVRAWGNKESHGLEFGSCDNWQQLIDVQKKHGVNDPGVFIDSGYGARSDSEVYGECAMHSDLITDMRPPMLIGWTPTKGFHGRKRWRHDDGAFRPYHLIPVDPFEHTPEKGQVQMNLLEFASNFFKDILEGMRHGRGGYVWGVEESMSTEIYWRHLAGQVRITEKSWNGKSEEVWKRRSKDWPDHGFACEYGQVAAATHLGRVDIETPK